MFEGLAQPMHLLVILFIALLFFGPSKVSGPGQRDGTGYSRFQGRFAASTAVRPTRPSAQGTVGCPSVLGARALLVTAMLLLFATLPYQ